MGNVKAREAVERFSFGIYQKNCKDGKGERREKMRMGRTAEVSYGVFRNHFPLKF